MSWLYGCQAAFAWYDRRRGRSHQVIVYSGIDPLTGRKIYLRESTADEAEARRVLRKLPARAVRVRPPVHVPGRGFRARQRVGLGADRRARAAGRWGA